ncbi:MAG: HMA2 domain-containing protein [Desulfobacterales bacterium]|jgi:cation transport ATPase
MNVYIHNVPGRLRVKIPSIKHLNHEARKVESLFDFRDGIERVRANALTGSLTITYDPERFSADQLLTALRENGYLETDHSLANAANDYVAATRVTQAVGKAMINWAISKTLESSGLGLLSVLI